MVWLKQEIFMLACFIQLVQPGLVNVMAKHGKYRLAKQPHYISDLTDGPTRQNCNAQNEIYTLFFSYGYC